MIKTGTVVQLGYTLKDKKGEVLDQSDKADPFTYLHGGGQIVPGLETALEGLKAGDKKKVVVSPEEGYGKSNPGLKISVKRSQFPAGVELKKGMQFQADAGGQGVVFTVAEIEGDEIHIDGNHPLADVELHFDVEVLHVRPATKEEMEHGHAHGPEGHGHDHVHHHGHDHDHGHDDEEEEGNEE
jgi:FKBP-type peptidyl-prolyl cis-trans isomerase SlyD